MRLGRRGQKQHGIDGFDPLDASAIVYQATIKKKRQYKKLLEDLRKLDSEWPGSPNEFVFAVATPRDADLQERVLQLNKNRIAEQKCPVEILDWNEISQHIKNSSELRQKYYPELFGGDMFTEQLQLTDVDPPDIDVRKVKSILEGDTVTHHDGRLEKKWGILWYARQVVEQAEKAGWAAVSAIVNDGNDPVYPLDYRRIVQVVDWAVFDRSELVPFRVDEDAEFEYFTLSHIWSAPPEEKSLCAGDGIHKSRLLIFDSDMFSRREIRHHAVEWMLKIECASREGPTNGIIPKWTLNWIAPPS